MLLIPAGLFPYKAFSDIVLFVQNCRLGFYQFAVLANLECDVFRACPGKIKRIVRERAGRPEDVLRSAAAVTVSLLVVKFVTVWIDSDFSRATGATASFVWAGVWSKSMGLSGIKIPSTGRTQIILPGKFGIAVESRPAMHASEIDFAAYCETSMRLRPIRYLLTGRYL